MNMERIEKKINSAEFKRNFKWFLIYYIIGVSVFAPTIINNLSNPDAIWNSFIYKTDAKWEVSLGRYLIKYIYMLRSGVINIQLVTLLSVALLAVIAVLLCQPYMFNINGTTSRFLTGCLVICTPNICSTLSYYFCSDIYMIGYLFAVLSTVILLKYPKDNKKDNGRVTGFLKSYSLYIVLSALFLCLSLSIYQAYISVAAAVYLFVLIRFFVNGEGTTGKILKKALAMIISAILGVLLYVLSSNIVQSILNIPHAENRDFNNINISFLINLPKNIQSVYHYFFQYFFGTELLNNSYGFRGGVNIIAFVVIVFTVVFGIIFAGKNISIAHKIITAVLICLIPVAVMCIVIMGFPIDGATGILTVPCMNYVYFLPVMLISNTGAFKPGTLKKSRGEKVVSSVSSASAVLSHAVIIPVLFVIIIMIATSQTYAKYNMDKMDFVSLRIVEYLEALGTAPMSTICVLGTMEDGAYIDQYSLYDESLKWMSASCKTVWGDDIAASTTCWTSYISQKYSKNYFASDREQIKRLLESGVPETMNVFPMPGSITYFENATVIKLSN